MNYQIEITLKSDTTFGRGDGEAGLVDAEVEQDEYGLPFLRGRALKGLLREECENILFLTAAVYPNFSAAAKNLFGVGGSGLNEDAEMHIGNAILPQQLKDSVGYQIQEGNLNSKDILSSLTAIRRQTAMTEKGTPRENSLRSMRVILRNITFSADLHFRHNFAPDSDEILLLGVCCRALQRAGLSRNRGRGKLAAKLIYNGDITENCINAFEGKLN